MEAKRSLPDSSPSTTKRLKLAPSSIPAQSSAHLELVTAAHLNFIKGLNSAVFAAVRYDKAFYHHLVDPANSDLVKLVCYDDTPVFYPTNFACISFCFSLCLFSVKNWLEKT